MGTLQAELAFSGGDYTRAAFFYAKVMDIKILLCNRFDTCLSILEF
jgi:hypothetical protein